MNTERLSLWSRIADRLRFVWHGEPFERARKEQDRTVDALTAAENAHMHAVLRLERARAELESRKADARKLGIID